MVDLGFATRGINQTVTIPDDQLPFILNFDETCLLLDGSERRRGGRPVITLHDPWFPYNGKQANKDGLTATLVCGSNDAGKALPPHFQFQTKKATTDDGKRLRNEVFKYCRQVIGRFETDSKRGATYSLNMKEGMVDHKREDEEG